MKTCRFCRQEVDDHARRCSHCQADISLLGRLRGVQTMVSAVIAVGGLGFGIYEKHIADGAKTELKQEQEALVKVLDETPEQDIAEKYKHGKTENALRADLKKNPKNIDARIRLRYLQHRKNMERRRKQMAKKSNDGRVSSRKRTGRRPPFRTSSRRGNSTFNRDPRVQPASGVRKSNPPVRNASQ